MTKKTSPKKRRRKLFEPLRLNLSEDCGLERIEVFAELQQQLAQLASGEVQQSSRYQQRRQAILQQVQSGVSVMEFLHSPSDVRLCLALWRESQEFFQHAAFNTQVLKTLKRSLNPPSRLLLWQLIQLYFEFYQTLPSYRGLATYIAEQFRRLPPRVSESQELQAYRQQAESLFCHEASQAVAQAAERTKTPLVMLARQWHIPDMSAFSQQTKAHYYLQPLQALNLGEVVPMLTEVQQEEVKTASMGGELLLGHHVARALMEQVLAAKADLPESWRHVILGILDDPRVPRSSPQFQAWWGRLDKKYVLAMRGWLSKLDLKLFLNILEEVARTHNRKDLLRMYPARKRFLEGLQAQGLITESRLLLGKQARAYIQEEFDERDFSSFGSLGSADASLIYLNLQGVHILEGTHSFQARIYHDLPIAGLADYETDKFSLASIRKYAADFTVKHSHSPVPRWQHALIETLAQPPFNLYIDPVKVLSAADYRVYVEKLAD